MRVVLAIEVELDEGRRPSTGFRRLDQVVRTVASFVARLRFVETLGAVTIYDTVGTELGAVQVRYDGETIAPSLKRHPVGIRG